MTDRPELRPKRVAALVGEQIVRVAMGETHTIALSAQGKLWCWGTDAGGRGASKTGMSYKTPTSVAGLEHGETDSACVFWHPIVYYCHPIVYYCHPIVYYCATLSSTSVTLLSTSVTLSSTTVPPYRLPPCCLPILSFIVCPPCRPIVCHPVSSCLPPC